MGSNSLEQVKGKKLAFISVFEKTGLDTLAKALVDDYGYAILSTGGTYKFLLDKNIPAIETSEITGFEELLGGRVKSLHPAIFAAILAERDKAGTPEYVMPDFLIETVVVNLYPFEKEKAAQESGKSEFGSTQTDPDHLLHFIDIGGSSLIRSAAKNYPAVNVLCDPVQYPDFLSALKTGKGETTRTFRRQLAHQAFQRSLAYEAAITQELKPEAAASELTDVTLPLLKIQDLRYGENPHQQAALYGLGTRAVPFECLSGKELSFNNILDMESAWALVSEFSALESAACAIIKHNNPCGVAISEKSLSEAYRTAFDVDPLSAFGGVVAFNSPVDKQTADLMKDVFLEVIVAPDFSPEAVDILTAKKNLRLVKHQPLQKSATAFDLKQVSPDLFLMQRGNGSQQTEIDLLLSESQVVTDAKPSAAQLKDMVFAWKVVKHVKSNAIVLAHHQRTVGIGVGQTSRIGALENALKLACDEAKGAVLASDGFLPHEDNIHAAAQARVTAIIQPGGSIKDKDVIALADQNNIAMLLTGVREFKH